VDERRRPNPHYRLAGVRNWQEAMEIAEHLKRQSGRRKAGWSGNELIRLGEKGRLAIRARPERKLWE
jgi:hypothetical protein